MADLRAFHGPNAGYVLELYERFRSDPDSVDAEWRRYFETSPPPVEDEAPRETGGVQLAQAVAAYRYAEAIRRYGHTAAELDPLGGDPDPDPSLEASAHGVDEAALRSLPASIVGGSSGSAAEALAHLRQVYSGPVAYEFHHIADAVERAWLQDAAEGGRFGTELDDETKRILLRRLSQVEGFEQFLHRAFFGQKRFSIEGTDTLVSILDRLVEEAGRGGTDEVVIGMAHRGRLNVLAHVMEKPYELIVGGFMAAAGVRPGDDDPRRTGDVKYHMGWEGSHAVDGGDVRVRLAPNPSHLEFVNPVVAGMTRALQTDHRGGEGPTADPSDALPVIVHGDAAFPGQGVVAETFNFSRLPGFTVGGILHLIANNQIGFTTDPEEGRSTRYASDLAKGFEVPVVHVNADDVEACVQVARLAFAYRARFGKDFVIDLVGYRRWGHNEGDEPAFTQPIVYERIANQPTARARWAERLVASGVVSEEEADAMLEEVMDHLERVKESLQHDEYEAEQPFENGRRKLSGEAGTTPASEARLEALNRALYSWPEDFSPHRRLVRQLERRRDALGSEEPAIDWGHAEALAFATLLEDGVPIRLIGQDAERGTFSHRHAVLHDVEQGTTHTPLAALASDATFEIRNSPLTEMGVVGFEYGYTVAAPEALVLWEAQFGDFVNGAQVIIDQFLSAGHGKWGQTSGLVLLLPHGYEGQGPEHSSARLERFLQLAAEDNLRVVNCSTAGQYYHLLRRQARLLREDPRPLVVMSPKSLLRHPLAAVTASALAEGEFQPVMQDETLDERAEGITRLLFCSGKVVVDLISSDLREEADRVGFLRVEELYPFPASRITEIVERLPSLQEIVWVQEEPANMGAWRFVEPRLGELAPGQVTVRYVGRPERASPAEGYPDVHAETQQRIVREAWSNAPAKSGKPGGKRAKTASK